MKTFTDFTKRLINEDQRVPWEYSDISLNFRWVVLKYFFKSDFYLLMYPSCERNCRIIQNDNPRQYALSNCKLFYLQWHLENRVIKTIGHAPIILEKVKDKSVSEAWHEINLMHFEKWLERHVLTSEVKTGLLHPRNFGASIVLLVLSVSEGELNPSVPLGRLATAVQSIKEGRAWFGFPSESELLPAYPSP